MVQRPNNHPKRTFPFGEVGETYQFHRFGMDRTPGRDSAVSYYETYYGCQYVSALDRISADSWLIKIGTMLWPSLLLFCSLLWVGGMLVRSSKCCRFLPEPSESPLTRL